MLSEIQQKVVGILSKVSKRGEEDIRSESCLAQDLNIKSVNRIEIAALLEDAFKIQIDNPTIMKAKSVADVVAIVERLVGS